MRPSIGRTQKVLIIAAAIIFAVALNGWLYLLSPTVEMSPWKVIAFLYLFFAILAGVIIMILAANNPAEAHTWPEQG
jgi:hypothetical protein